MNLKDILAAMCKWEPPEQGVYVLMKRGVPIYVGRSENPQYRITKHRKDGVVFDEAFYAPISGEIVELGRAEGLLIETLRPTLNRTGITTTHPIAVRNRRPHRERKQTPIAARQAAFLNCKFTIG